MAQRLGIEGRRHLGMSLTWAEGVPHPQDVAAPIHNHAPDPRIVTRVPTRQVCLRDCEPHPFRMFVTHRQACVTGESPSRGVLALVTGRAGHTSARPSSRRARAVARSMSVRGAP